MTTPALRPTLLLLVALGGAVGASGRWGLAQAFPEAAGAFPWTTFAVNVVGSLLLGAAPAVSVVRRSERLAVLLGPGLLGGFTTLSAYSEQVRSLAAAGHLVLAGSYLAGTFGACLVAVALGQHLSARSAP